MNAIINFIVNVFLTIVFFPIVIGMIFIAYWYSNGFFAALFG